MFDIKPEPLYQDRGKCGNRPRVRAPVLRERRPEGKRVGHLRAGDDINYFVEIITQYESQQSNYALQHHGLLWEYYRKGMELVPLELKPVLDDLYKGRAFQYLTRG